MKQTKSMYCASIASILLLTSQTNCNTVTAEISYGELIDKITILTIKSERITNADKLKNVHTELASLQRTCTQCIANYSMIEHLQTILQKTNQTLWDIEDAIRVKERNREFDDEFIELARSVYITNDKRCMLKKEIDMLLGSHITEEKSYEELV
jgi:hypothetical protein